MQLCRSQDVGAAWDMFLVVDGVNPMTIKVNNNAFKRNLIFIDSSSRLMDRAQRAEYGRNDAHRSAGNDNI